MQNVSVIFLENLSKRKWDTEDVLYPPCKVTPVVGQSVPNIIYSPGMQSVMCEFPGKYLEKRNDIQNKM